MTSFWTAMNRPRSPGGSSHRRASRSDVSSGSWTAGVSGDRSGACSLTQLPVCSLERPQVLDELLDLLDREVGRRHRRAGLHS